MHDRRIRLVSFLVGVLGIAALLMLIASQPERAVILRTLTLGFGACLISIPIGTVLAWVILGRGRVSSYLLLTTIGLLFVPMFMHVSAWDSAFGKLGWYSTGGDSLQPILTGWTAAIWVHGIAAAPQVALILWFGLMGGGKVYEEQALLDADSFSVFTGVTIRRAMPLVGLGMLWTLLTCAREIAVTDIFRVGTLAEQIYLGYSLGQLNNLNLWSPQEIADAESTRWQLCVAFVFLCDAVCRRRLCGCFSASQLQR